MMMKLRTKLAIATVGALPLIAGGVAFASTGHSAPPAAIHAVANHAPLQTNAQSGNNVQSGSQSGPDLGVASESEAAGEAVTGSDTGPNVQQGANVQSGSQTGPETPDAAGSNA